MSRADIATEPARTAATGAHPDLRPHAQGAGIFEVPAAATGAHPDLWPHAQGAGIFKVEEQRS